jgi:MFS family permease
MAVAERRSQARMDRVTRHLSWNRRNLAYKSFITARVMNSQENTMRRIFGKFGIASAAAIVIAIGSITVSSPASAQYRHGGGWHGGGWHGGGYRGGYYGGGWGWGGFAAGAALGALLATPYYYRGCPYYYDYGPPSDSAVAYCLRRFKSYDPRSGTYLGYDGYRHPCP